VPPNTIFVTDHTTGYFVNVLPDWLIVILSLECYIVICIDWLHVYFTALCFSHVEVRFDISVIKELIDWLIDWLALLFVCVFCSNMWCAARGVLSLVLFSVLNTDDLIRIRRLFTANLGCYISNLGLCRLFYADDIVLLSGSLCCYVRLQGPT